MYKRVRTVTYTRQSRTHVTVTYTQSRTVFHHDGEELDDDLGARSDQDLPLASLASVVDRLQSVVQYVHSHHGDGGLGMLLVRSIGG